jgi:hypothetical protein
MTPIAQSAIDIIGISGYLVFQLRLDNDLPMANSDTLQRWEFGADPSFIMEVIPEPGT